MEGSLLIGMGMNNKKTVHINWYQCRRLKWIDPSRQCTIKRFDVGSL